MDMRDVVEMGLVIYTESNLANVHRIDKDNRLQAFLTSKLKSKFPDGVDSYDHGVHNRVMKQLSIMRDHLDELIYFKDMPPKYHKVINACGDGDINRLLRIDLNSEIVSEPEYAVGKELFDRIDTDITNTNVVREVYKWLKENEYDEDTYIKEMLNRKRKFASVGTREIFG